MEDEYPKWFLKNTSGLSFEQISAFDGPYRLVSARFEGKVPIKAHLFSRQIISIL